MDLHSFENLLSTSGQSALHEAENLHPAEASFLSCFDQLRRIHPAELARSALEMAILRQDAAAKFPKAGQMYFTRPAMEQASSYPISTYRAERYRSYKVLVDLGCSIGGDTFALAGVAPTAGIDIDPLRVAMGRENLRVLEVNQRSAMIVADLEETLPIRWGPGTGVFFDPARRIGHRRVFSVKDYQPPLAIIKDWLKEVSAIGVKISPGVVLSELAQYDAEIEFISLNGELKEAVLWFGDLKSTGRRATLLPEQCSLAAPADHGSRTRSDEIPLSEPRQYIYEPDPAVLRAGLVQRLGLEIGAAQLDRDIAYLTSDQPGSTPFARSWQVEAWFPFQLKRLRQVLREQGVGRVVIKKRGSPLQPEALIHDLRLAGPEQRVVFLTHLRGRPIAIIALTS